MKIRGNPFFPPSCPRKHEAKLGGAKASVSRTRAAFERAEYSKHDPRDQHRRKKREADRHNRAADIAVRGAEGCGCVCEVDCCSWLFFG